MTLATAMMMGLPGKNHPVVGAIRWSWASIPVHPLLAVCPEACDLTFQLRRGCSRKGSQRRQDQGPSQQRGRPLTTELIVPSLVGPWLDKQLMTGMTR